MISPFFRAISLMILTAVLCGPNLIHSPSIQIVSAAVTPPPERVTASNEANLERLSPDLRALARQASFPALAPARNSAMGNPLTVTVMIEPGAAAAVRAMLSYPAASREVGGTRWVTGQIETQRLVKLAGLPGVRLVFSSETFQTAEAPGLADLRTSSSIPPADVRTAAQLAASGDLKALHSFLSAVSSAVQPRVASRMALFSPSVSRDVSDAPTNPAQVHGVPQAQALGLRGEGVTVAVVDTGVDFGHPDLIGTQAVVASGPYAGWPFAYDVLSGYYYVSHQGYALDPLDHAGRLGNTNYAATVPVNGAKCNQGECFAELLFGEQKLPVSMRWPDRSRSGKYYYSILPDAALVWQSYYGGLGYPGGLFISPLVITSDEINAGVYDAVYTDVNYDGQLTAGERMSKEQPTVGVDLNGDGVWDLSAGLLTWISDGVHYPPGVAQIYPETNALQIPESGRLLTFINDAAGHGTSCAGQIAAQGRITDPLHRGPVNPLLSGPVLSGMAPGSRIAAFQNGFSLPLDAWTLSALGFDGLPASGDEVQLVSNSWGSSTVVADGWDEVSRFAHDLNLTPDPQTGVPLAEQVTFLAATGNGGHGYGTVTAPAGGTILDIGASTLYGNLSIFEPVAPDQILRGEIQPWSNRGPSALGDLAPDLAAVGAWGTGALPLNIFIAPDGQSAYDVFGGTSMSTPIAAGGGALVYQAFRQQHNRWPTWREARDLLLGGARELGYEPSVQGAGEMRVDRSVLAALDQAPSVDPPEWAPSSENTPAYPAFPHLLNPGETTTQDFTLSNPTALPLDASLSAVRLQRVHEETFTIPYTPPGEGYRSADPLYLEDLRSILQAYPADMVRAQLVLPYTAFDLNNDYYEDQWWRIAFYDWSDRDGDGLLWKDANRDGQVQTSELDGASPGNLSEINRFTYAYPAGTVLEASLGREGLAQAHDGVFLGLSCVFCGNSTTLQIRLSFYRYTPWDWVQLNSDHVTVSPAGKAVFQAEMSIPPDAAPGYYEGYLRAEMPDRSIAVPLTAQVAIPSATFAISPGGDAPYPNANLQGGFNWHWRYESGDWRFFYFSPPPAPAGQITRGILDLGWNSPATDLDAFVFGPASSGLSNDHPDLFGPSTLEQTAASSNAYILAGKFRRETVTTGPREVLSFDPRSGLNMLAFHQVLSGGDQHSEPLTASVFTLSASPFPADWVEPLKFSPNSSPYLSGTRTLQLTTSAPIPDGLRLQAYGFSPRIEIPSQTVKQDDPYNLCSVSWIYHPANSPHPQDGLNLLSAGLLDISTSSTQPNLDVDLIVLRDDGDGVYECNQDRLAYYSSGPTAQENLRVNFPLDGEYWIGVQGFSVPNDTGVFDISIRAVQGTALRLRGLPVGPLAAGQTVDLKIDFTQPYPSASGEVLDGLIYAGLPSVPGLVEIPLSLRPAILLQPPAWLAADSPSVFAQPVAVRLTVANAGAQPETAQASIILPSGLEYVPASAAGPGAPPTFDPQTRSLSWTGPVPPAASVQLSFSVVADPLYPPGPVEIQAQVDGLISAQSASPHLTLQVNRNLYYFPLVGR